MTIATNGFQKYPLVWLLASQNRFMRSQDLCSTQSKEGVSGETFEVLKLSFRFIIKPRIPSGELTFGHGKIHHAINGKIHYFYGHVPLLFVCSPEGTDRNRRDWCPCHGLNFDTLCGLKEVHPRCFSKDIGPSITNGYQQCH